MKCRDLREQILTDYFDGRMEGATKEALEAHLAVCEACRAYAATARKAVIEPFSRAERVTPPESLWQQLSARIEAEQGSPVTPEPGFTEKLKSLFRWPKPAFAAAAVVALLVVAVVTMRLPRIQEETVTTAMSEEIEYITDLLEGPNQVATLDGYGTLIEEYFL